MAPEGNTLLLDWVKWWVFDMYSHSEDGNLLREW
jgi:hypothetical protein